MEFGPEGKQRHRSVIADHGVVESGIAGGAGRARADSPALFGSNRMMRPPGFSTRYASARTADR